jgi:quinol monooxygenase YgiN
MSKSLTVIARVRAKKGKASLLRKELRRLIALTRAEAGCINYDLHESQDDPALFVFYENWKSAADLAAHMRTPHFQAAMKLLPKLVDGPVDITKWSKVK